MLGDAVEVTRRLRDLVELRAALHRRRRATSTRTRSATSSRSRSTGATSRRARRSSSRISTSCARAARRRRPRLASRLGFDIGDPGFWSAGLDAIGALVDEAEQLAAQLDEASNDCYFGSRSSWRRPGGSSSRSRARGRVVCGIGPVEAAVATARALAEERPSAVLHVGIAGARGLEPLTLVLGSEAVYCDAAGPLVAALVRCPTLDLLSRLRDCVSRTRACGRSGRARASAAPTTSTSRRWRASRSCARASSQACRRSRCARRLERDRRARPGAAGSSTRRSRLLGETAAAAGRGSVLPREQERSCRRRFRPRPARSGSSSRETLKLYGATSGRPLALGISVAAINQVSVGHDTLFQVLVLAAGSPLMAASYTGASAIVGGVRPRREDVVRAIVVGSIVFVPAASSHAPVRAPGRRVARLGGARRAGDRDRAPGDAGCLPPRDPAGPRRLRPRARVARDAAPSSSGW